MAPPTKSFRNHSEAVFDFHRRQIIAKIFASVVIVALVSFHVISFFGHWSLLRTSQAVFQQFMHLPPKSHTSSSSTKVVLLWTKFFSNAQWSDHFQRNGGPLVEISDDHRRRRACHFTTDRSLFNEADAVIFHGRDMNFLDLPTTRFPKQRFVFFLIESPTHSGFGNEEDWGRVNGIQFNWTMGYTTTADVFFPYGKIRQSTAVTQLDEILVEKKITNFAASFWQRPKDAVWVVSNCVSPSVRELIVSKLQEAGVMVDVWGRCGLNSLDDEWKKIGGERAFYERYRFVLAFENSLCDDYITEKAFHAFYANYIAGTIPVVYGLGRYLDFFQNGSFIDVNNFSSIVNLARLLKDLSAPNASLGDLLPYYQWQKALYPRYEKGYEIDHLSDYYVQDNYKRSGWQNLCQKLWTDNGYQTIGDLRTTLGKCYPPMHFAKELFPQLNIPPNVKLP